MENFAPFDEIVESWIRTWLLQLTNLIIEYDSYVSSHLSLIFISFYNISAFSNNLYKNMKIFCIQSV